VSAACRAHSLSQRDQAAQRNAHQNDGLDRKYNAVYGRRVRQNGLDISEIDSDRDGTGAFPRLLLPELDETPAIKFRDSQPPQSVLKRGQARRFGSSNTFAYLLQVFTAQLNQIADCALSGRSVA
jgi:hypothetical protein